MHATVDYNDEYLRSRGEDPLAQEKAAFLSATFDLRMELARRTHAAAISRAADEIPAQLARIWADERLTVRERRRLLFEIWLDADDPDSSPAGAVRRAVETFVRERLPPGSPDAYPPAELERLRARPGAASFTPDPPRRP